ncbi:ATP synthase subunit b [Gordonia araii NBRC 100433]|uniref:ATP synthase subunit b n=1 Tax=Gordonia araii NBRC 100433 TaxID=1073574 RepID=G7H6Q7_9ACTN|nr:F0F1 ATP synthase subunit B [Gordonia araii]NNG98620.1 F0F1 ATP synthase subunit B [Gordonia araii NBRC 100433]GAB11532.1 ATP synthase subunit b [Gordonia araii NBRC 100433]
MINATELTLLLAAEDGEQHNPLLPHTYDIVWSTVAFALVFFVFWKFVIPRYQKVLEERRDAIEGGIERAEAAQAQANAELAAYREKLSGAREEANAIREEARAQGQQIVADASAAAQAESDRIVAAGNQQLEASRQQVVSELRNDVGKMSIDLAEKLVGESLGDASRQSATIERFLAEIDPAAK